MIHILLVSDGPRDEAVIPPLAEVVFKVEVKADFKTWKSMHLAGKGYGRKLKFAVRSAVSNGIKLLVATIDSDKDETRSGLKDMEKAVREDPNCQGLVHVALGEANPHAEAWLLDDEVAVRMVLRLDVSAHGVAFLSGGRVREEHAERIRAHARLLKVVRSQLAGRVADHEFEPADTRGPTVGAVRRLNGNRFCADIRHKLKDISVGQIDREIVDPVIFLEARTFWIEDDDGGIPLVGEPEGVSAEF